MDAVEICGANIDELSIEKATAYDQAESSMLVSVLKQCFNELDKLAMLR